MHQGVVAIALAVVELVRIEGLQALVVADGAHAQIGKAGHYCQYEDRAVEEQLPIEHHDLSQGSLPGAHALFCGNRLGKSSQSIPELPQDHETLRYASYPTDFSRSVRRKSACAPWPGSRPRLGKYVVVDLDRCSTRLARRPLA